MDVEYTQLQELIKSTIDTEVNKRVGLVEEENSDLRVEVCRLKNKISDLTDTLIKARSNESMSAIMLDIVNQLNYRIQETEDTDKKEGFVYNFLDLLFKPDFDESTYEVPTWLGAVTNFYSNKEFVIQVLNLLHIKMPNNVANFRLPMDWTEEELDCFFDTMRNHIVCNGCTFKDNLRFWKPFVLSSVEDNCNTNYSEIPWQFVLRNPILLKEKYLKKIGQMAFAEPYISGWRYFFEIDKYQDMTDEQIKTIIKEIDGPGANIGKENSVSEFLLRHLDLIEDGILIDKIYKKYWDSFSFRCKDLISKLPVNYIELWVKEKAHRDPREALDWIISNKNKFSEEQKNNLLKLVMSEVLK